MPLSRELYMKTGQGFLLVFSITSRSSLDELQELREQIIRIKDDEHVPIVIVGNKSDLEGDRMVSRSKAFSLSQSWGNAPYYETSARRRGMFKLVLSFCPKMCFKMHACVEAPPSPRSPEPQRRLTHNPANVDEVFVDLCRQIIRKDNEMAAELDEEPETPRPGKSKMRLMHRRKDGSHTRCVIL